MNAVDCFIAHTHMRNSMVKPKAVYKASSGLKDAKEKLENSKFREKYVKMARMDEPAQYIVGNLIYSKYGFIGEFNVSNYQRYTAMTSFTDTFKVELKKLRCDMKTLIEVPEDGIPVLLQEIVNGTFDLTATIILDRLTHFTKLWEDSQVIKDDSKLSKLILKIKKLGKLITVTNSADKYRAIILDHFEPLKR